MNNILEVLLIVFLMFAPVFLLVEAVLFSCPKDWWLWVVRTGKYSWLIIKTLWCYLHSDRYGCIKNCLQERIDLLTEHIDFFQSKKYYESLLSRIEKLAKKYRKVQDQVVHPEKSAWEVHENAYKPFYRLIALQSLSVIFLLFAWWIFFGFELNPIEELRKILGFSKDGKGFAEILIALLGLFPALIVWFYRDLNKYREMETAHRDVMFKEHKQLVEWATTEAKKDDNAVTEVNKHRQDTSPNVPMIQVAGIYQLAPFLKDHHANLYQRSTLETLRAIVNAGRSKWDSWILWLQSQEIGFDSIMEGQNKPTLTAAERAVHAVLRENSTLFYHPYFNAKEFNLAGFDGSGLVLVGCDLSEAQLQCANFSNASLESALFNSATLTKANFKDAKLYGSSFIKSYLVGSTFNKASLLSGANFSNADLREVDLSFGFVARTQESLAIFNDAVVSEPKLLVKNKPLENALNWLILNGAVSVAWAPYNLDIHLIGNCFNDGMRTLEFLEAQGLTATTKASLEAEMQAQATTEK